MTLRTLLRTFGLMAVVLLPLAASAQTVKLGYLDPDIIVVRMPEYAQVRDTLQMEEQQISADLQAREDTLRTKFQELQSMADSPLMTPEARNTREQEILQMQADLEQRQQFGMQYLSRREAQMLQPLLLRLQGAIDAVSAQQGLLMVFSARANNAPVILYADESTVNITEPVMRQLGLEIPANTDVPVGAEVGGN